VVAGKELVIGCHLGHVLQVAAAADVEDEHRPTLGAPGGLGGSLLVQLCIQGVQRAFTWFPGFCLNPFYYRGHQRGHQRCSWHATTQLQALVTPADAGPATVTLCG
jgi:hypothetical protein